MTATVPSIEQILGRFFPPRLAALSGLRRQRLEDAAARLRRCLEVEGPQLLGEADQAILGLERQFTKDAAFATCMAAPQLLAVLLRFAGEDWLPEHREDRRVQLRVADALIDFLLAERLLDRRASALAVLQAQVAIISAKAAIR